MFNLLQLRLIQGRQYIKDIRKAVVPKPFRGFPAITDSSGGKFWDISEICPTGAIDTSPLSIDLGKCVFCGECERAYPQYIRFENYHQTSADKKDKLIIKPGLSLKDFRKNAIGIRQEIYGLFNRSLKLRSVCAGGCNACEMEMNACSNVNFDMGRFGIEIVASPRHADGIIITGPITSNMAEAVMDTYKSIPQPKIVIAVGSCAISGGLFKDPAAINREFFNLVKTDLFVPGCPVHPLTFVNGVLDFIRKK